MVKTSNSGFRIFTRWIRLVLISHGKLRRWERMSQMLRHFSRRGDKILLFVIHKFMIFEACHVILVSYQVHRRYGA